MHPRRLELLLELSRLGSMREVAELMNVTTSTVSQQIAVLSREAGTALVEPDGRRVRLTPAGRRLADHAVTILAALEAARVDLDPEAGPGRHGPGRGVRLRRTPVAAARRRHPGAVAIPTYACGSTSTSRPRRSGCSPATTSTWR